MKHRCGRLLLTFAMLCVPLVVLASEPDMKVARVSYTGGEVSYQRGDSDGWNVLGINTPLVTGDSLYTADDGRAEVHLGSGNVLRMDAGTQVDLLRNAPDLAQLGLRSGYLSLRVRSAAESNPLEIDTPNGAATIVDPGLYRVELTDRGARYSVVKGRLSVSLSGQQLDVDAGESLAIEGTDRPEYTIDPVAPETSFDRWAYDRDVRAERSRSARYVHHDVVGYEDLDDHGTWRDTSDYGRVWTPSGVPSDWAPYQAGRWIWQDPYGWTWVSDESWGWAPYHYGRWLFVAGAWGWVPPPPVGFHGPSVVAEIRPNYAPALVAFVGGRNWSVGVSLGGGPSIGWVPLAPAERYYYPWQPAPRVTNNYTNITVINAVTVVNSTNFSTGRIRPLRVPPREVIHAPALGYAATEVVPTHDSLCPSHPRDPHSKYVPRREDRRPLIVRTSPPPEPVPFHEKVVEIQRTGRPFEGHDRGEHTGWNRHGDRDDRTAIVSALTPAGRKEWTPQPGNTAKPPRPIDQRVDMTPRPERAHPKDGDGRSPQSDSRNERPGSHNPSWPAPRQPAVAKPAVAPVEHPAPDARMEDRHAPPSERHDPRSTPVPHGAAPAAPESAPDRSTARPPETVREGHVAPSTPHPAVGAPVAQAGPATPRHEASKPEAPKTKDQKVKGKDKHASEEQPQDR